MHALMRRFGVLCGAWVIISCNPQQDAIEEPDTASMVLAVADYALELWSRETVGEVVFVDRQLRRPAPPHPSPDRVEAYASSLHEAEVAQGLAERGLRPCTISDGKACPEVWSRPPWSMLAFSAPYRVGDSIFVTAILGMNPGDGWHADGREFEISRVMGGWQVVGEKSVLSEN